MAETVTVRNNANEPVLVGDRYLLPGEQRQVLASHLASAAGKDRLLIIETESADVEVAPPVVETEAAVEAHTPATEPEKPARSRRSGK